MCLQVSVYKLLARNEPVPPALAAEAVFMKNKPTSLLPEPYEFPGEGDNGEKLPYDLMKVCGQAIPAEAVERAV